MSEINLLKSELTDDSPLSFLPKGQTSLFIVVGLVILEMLVYGGLLFYDQSLHNQAKELDKKVADNSLEVARFDADKKLAISSQRQINNINVLLARHVYWSEFFKELEKYTHKDSFYTSLGVSESDRVVLVSGVSKSITTLAKLVAGLKQAPSITDVLIQSSNLNLSGDGGYTFNLEVDFSHKILEKNAEK
ncbi:hypothetical protein D4R52_01495 [bacterium]|nr:MAG: hypothetical protein D4R52_01495 [bacterium]